MLAHARLARPRLAYFDVDVIEYFRPAGAGHADCLGFHDCFSLLLAIIS